MNVEKLYEILLEDKPSIAIKENEDYVFSLIPELKVCKGFEQNNPWHIYDVYEHILHVIDEIPKDLNLRIVALFHDIGKPRTYTVDEEGVGHFHNHWNVSKEIFLDFCKRNDIKDLPIDKIAQLITFHDIRFKDVDDKALEFFKYFDLEFINNLFAIKRADLLGQNPEYHYQLKDYEIQKEKILEYKNNV